MAEALQFGEVEPGQDYVDRPAAFGVLLHEGCVALVQVTEADDVSFHLPGGALDPGESEAEALVREFAEETGLKVRAGALLGRAGQYKIGHGRRVNNRSAHFIVERLGEDPSLKIEEDHELVWLEPLEAIARLRHGSHAWAVTCWLRSG